MENIFFISRTLDDPCGEIIRKVMTKTDLQYDTTGDMGPAGDWGNFSKKVMKKIPDLPYDTCTGGDLGPASDPSDFEQASYIRDAPTGSDFRHVTPLRTILETIPETHDSLQSALKFIY
jgi:hypothetical protein